MAKKKHEHHGGAWKVAYADFVTSMMALFLVLWIANFKPEILIYTSLYFKDPTNKSWPTTWGVMEKEIKATRKDASLNDQTHIENQGFLRAIARDFNRLLNVNDEDKKPIDITITDDGLKMEIYNRTKKPLFKDNTTEFTEWGNFVFQNLSWLIQRYNFQVYLEGHTPKGLDLGPNKNYTPWELSTDRANAARRLMEYYAMTPEKMKRIAGCGDSQPLPNVPPDSEDNQRITVSLSLTQSAPPPPPAPGPGAAPATPNPTAR
jgi:chemotaxis protein MotB